MTFPFDIGITTWLAALSGFVNLLIGVLLIFAREKTSESDRLFGIVAFSIALWALFRVLFEVLPIGPFTDASVSLLYLSASLIPMFFFFFTLSFGKKKIELPIPVLLFIVLSYISIIAATLVPGFIFTDVVQKSGIKVIFFGPGYFFYSLYIVGYFTAGFLVLLWKYVHAFGIEKIHIKYIFFGTFFASVIGVFTNLILPVFGNFSAFWFGPVATMIMVLFVSYAIIRHRLFDVRVVTAEFLTGLLWFFILLRLFFVQTPKERLFEGALLLVAIILGVLLIRSAVKEVAARERIEALARHLKKANARLLELDKQKSEFVSIASHQLRSPLTAIRGYSSMILDGSFGDISGRIKDPVKRIYKSSQQLMSIVEDLLNMTRIEQGRMRYDMRRVNIVDIVREAVEELDFHAKESGLSLSFRAPESPVFVSADKEKIRQVFLNLIDNAIKYTPRGNVTVSVSQNEEGEAVISVADTGIGISPDLQGHLFEKFNRGENSTETHANGSGIGLYIAREITKAHGGEIKAESKKRGSVFTVILPPLQEKDGGA